MKLQKKRHRIFKTIKWLFGSLFFIIVLSLIVLSLPPVQTYVAKKAANYLTKKTGYPIKIDKLAIKWFDVIEAENLSVVDLNKNKLFDIEKVTIDYQLIKLLSKQEVELDYLKLTKPDFNVGWYPGDDLISFSEFVKILREVLMPPKKDKKKSKILPFNLEFGEIENGTFTYFDKRRVASELPNYFDYNYFTIDSISGHVHNFRIYLDSISLETDNLIGRHTNSHLHINELQTNFLYCNKRMMLDNLNLNLGNSCLKDSISFAYEKLSAFSHFNDSVKISARLKESVIYSKDLEVFAPQVSLFTDKWTISSDVEGFVSDFWLKNTELKFGSKSSFVGDLGFEGLPNIQETFMDLHFGRAKILPIDMRQYVRNDGFYQQGLKKLGETNFDGNFRGFINNFVANGDFNTQLGFVSTDVNFVLNKTNYSKSTYSGDLKTENFDLGKFLEISKLGQTDLSVKIKPGSYGFSTSTADVEMVGDIQKIKFNNYTYKDIHLDAALAKNIFNGHLDIEDPNIRLHGLANVNLNTNQTFVDMEGSIYTLNLQPLGFSKEKVELSGKMDIQLEGFNFDAKNGSLDIDNLNGKISLDSINALVKNENYKLVKVDFLSRVNGTERILKMNSSFLDASLIGDYKFKTIVKDFPNIVKEYMLFFENDKNKIEKHYAEKDKTVYNYQVSLKANLKNVNGLIALVDSNLVLSNNFEIAGELKRGVSSVFNFTAKPEYLKYDKYEFYNNEIDINSSKLIDSTSALASVYLKSKAQKIDGNSYFQDSDLLVNIENKNVDFVLKTSQFDSDNYLYFRGNADYFKDSLRITFDKSHLHLLNKNWYINDKNSVTILPDLVKFHEVSFNNDYQLLSIDGNLGKQKSDILNVKLRDFDIRNLQTLSGIELGGLISGDLDVLDAFNEIKLNSKLLIQDFAIMGDTLGKVKGRINWDNSLQKLDLDVDLIRDNLVVTHANGFYNVKNETSPINVEFTAKDAEFKLLEPFLSSYASAFRGKVNGKLNLSGTKDKPFWKGKLAFDNAGFMVNYFQTFYAFNHELVFDKESIYCENLKLIDTLWNTHATLDASISHHWFKDFSTNTELRLKNTFVLNTSQKENTLYYGNAFATGNIFMNGLFSNLKIWSKELTSNSGTAIYIPLEEPEALSRKEYITFVTKEDKIHLRNNGPAKELNLSGVDMDINFNITNDAYFEIIFDAQAGDVIKGRGDGLLNMKIDTRGDFNMFGQFAFNQGTYNFTLMDFINKKFEIQKGSKITWDGDPYEGQLSLDAVYEQYTSLSSLSADSTLKKTNPDINRKIPVDIHLGLTGKLMSPEVRFNIDIKQYPSSLESLVAEMTTKFNNDDQFRNKQVFSLIVLKQFSSDQNIGNVAGASSKNLSELFSNQFSSWISQFDENLNVAIDFTGYDPENSNIFRLKLEYSLLDGRLRVSRDGSFTNIENTNQLANVFGEWTIEYLITEDGKIRMKAFNKNSTISSITSNEASINTTYGASIMHNKSFDSLKDLFKKNPNVTQVSN